MSSFVECYCTIDRTNRPHLESIDRVIKAGLVERYRDEKDRRVVWMRLSAAGNATLSELWRIRARYLARHLRHLDVDELAQLTSLLSRTVAGYDKAGLI